jgi:hypothetical protein
VAIMPDDESLDDIETKYPHLFQILREENAPLTAEEFRDWLYRRFATKAE